MRSASSAYHGVPSPAAYSRNTIGPPPPGPPPLAHPGPPPAGTVTHGVLVVHHQPRHTPGEPGREGFHGVASGLGEQVRAATQVYDRRGLVFGYVAQKPVQNV